MSDKPTRAAAVAALEEYGWINEVATEAVILLSRQFPDLFAPEPDPVEQFIKDACLGCRLLGVLGDCTDDAGV